MAFTTDGTADFEGGVASPSLTTSGNLTSSLSGNWICVFILVNADSVASVTGGGVTFTRRATTGGTFPIEYWTGYSSGVFNAAITVTVTTTSSFVTIKAFALNGPPSSSPFDTNAGLPVTGGSDPVAISTTAADTFIVSGARMSGPSSTAGTGFTLALSSGGYTAVEYKVVSSPQSSLSVTLGSGAGTANGMIADAFILAGGSPATLSSPTPSGTLGTTTTATLGATSDQNTGTLYGVVSATNNVSGASATQIKAGENSTGAAADFANSAAVSTTSPTVGITGLTANTLYYYALVQNNANGDSNVVSGSFTTAAASSPANGLLTLGVG